MEQLKVYEPLWEDWYLDGLVSDNGQSRLYRIKRQSSCDICALKHIRIPRSSAAPVASDSPRILHCEGCTVMECEDACGWDILIRMEPLDSLTDPIHDRPMTINEIIRLGIALCSAPEAGSGEPCGIRADIASLGILMDRLLEEGQARLGDGQGPLEEIIRRACSADPLERYASPGELRQDLEAISRGAFTAAEASASRLPASTVNRYEQSLLLYLILLCGVLLLYMSARFPLDHQFGLIIAGSAFVCAALYLSLYKRQRRCSGTLFAVTVISFIVFFPVVVMPYLYTYILYYNSENYGRYLYVGLAVGAVICIFALLRLTFIRKKAITFLVLLLVNILFNYFFVYFNLVPSLHAYFGDLSWFFLSCYLSGVLVMDENMREELKSQRANALLLAQFFVLALNIATFLMLRAGLSLYQMRFMQVNFNNLIYIPAHLALLFLGSGICPIRKRYGAMENSSILAFFCVALSVLCVIV